MFLILILAAMQAAAPVQPKQSAIHAKMIQEHNKATAEALAWTKIYDAQGHPRVMNTQERATFQKTRDARKAAIDQRFPREPKSP